MGSGRRVGWMGALVVSALAVAGGAAAEAANWSRAYMNALPDEAFAVVEERPDGTRVRHLPHHDAQGRVDLPHLRSALSRLHQVHWVDPANAARARQHLLDHLRELGRSAPGGPRERHRSGSRLQPYVPGASLVAGAAHPRAPRQATSSPASTVKQPAAAPHR